VYSLAKVGVAGSNPVVRSRSEAVSECEAFPAGDSLGDSNVSDADGFTVHEQARAECISANVEAASVTALVAVYG
jgi:hypothetical protein